MKHTPIPVDFVRECFYYFSETGHLIWKARPSNHFLSQADCDRWNRRYAYKEAGRSDVNGRKWVSLKGVGMLLSARVIYAWYHGIDPGPRQVDHKDTNPRNDRIRNLRLATPSQNMFNQKLSKANTSGYKGVYYQKSRGKFVANIKINGKLKYLGSYTTREEAAIRVANERRKLHKRFANHG